MFDIIVLNDMVLKLFSVLTLSIMNKETVSKRKQSLEMSVLACSIFESHANWKHLRLEYVKGCHI